VRSAGAPAKINLALVVGPTRADGKHEVVTVMVALGLEDTIHLDPAPRTVVEGYPDDTIVTGILAALAAEAGHGAGWRAEIEKRIPVAAGLGGGSADAAVALRLANETLAAPLDRERLHRVAAAAGADVPFFLEPGPKLGTGDGSALAPVALPSDYAVLLALPHGEVKQSTSAVYRAFDERRGEEGFEERCAHLHDALAGVRSASDLARLPRNDLASSALADVLERLGAFRADVSGAGPTVYGLFPDADNAARAAEELAGRAATWVTAPRAH
jgi:4-diphosphocytidyl-2-C-methyl-D-erythritol kinase